MDIKKARVMRIVWLVLIISFLVSAAGCGNEGPCLPATPSSSPENDGSMGDDPEASVRSEEDYGLDMLIDTEYYTIKVPNSWEDDCFYEVTDGESYNYTLSFYNKASHEQISGGWLFSINLLTEFEDYTNYPDYDVLGSLEVYRTGSYNLVVTYPTDVQFSEETANKYNEMSESIPDILSTISFKEECTFSNAPIPVENSTVTQGSLSLDFYTELCTYVVSSCVNYTEWWNDPTLSHTDPTYYYLGNITAENYAEKMATAKQLVDGVYQVGYWEIRSRGYGTIKIGLYITPNDELYFCYRY
ncbi:MAG: hypothetical protein ACI3WR_02820 [Oscillospiraceae bacterium]